MATHASLSPSLPLFPAHLVRYLVKWDGYDGEDGWTWEPTGNITDRDILDRFKADTDRQLLCVDHSKPDSYITFCISPHTIHTPTPKVIPSPSLPPPLLPRPLNARKLSSTSNNQSKRSTRSPVNSQ